MPVIQLDLDSKGAVDGLKNYDNAVDKTEKNTGTAFERMKSSVGGLALAAGAAAAAIAAVFAGIAMRALDDASRMQEAQNKYDVVFTGMSDVADSWRSNLENNYHVSGLAATQYLGKTKAILDATGMESKAAGELSNNMVKLALDFASFADKPIATAIEATTAALTGEMEMMKQLDIVISADEVSQRAMIDNHIRNASAVTSAMKAQATYNIMLEKGAKAVGDVERSAGSYVTQLNDLHTLVKNVSVGIGQQLVPAATAAVKIFLNFAENEDAVTASSNAMNTALSYVVETIRFLYNGFQGLVMVGNTFVVALAYAADTTVALLQTLTYGFREASKVISEFFNIPDPLASVTTGLDKAREATQQFVESSKDVLKDQVKSIEETNRKFDEMSIAVDKQRLAQQTLTPAIENTTAALNDASSAAGKHVEAVENIHGTYIDTSKSTAGVMENIGGEWVQVSGAADSAASAINGVSTATSKMASAGNFTEESAEQFLSLKGAVDSANKAVEDHAKILKIDASPAEIKHHQALVALSDAAKSQMEAFEKNGVVTKELTRRHRDLGDSVHDSTAEFRTNFSIMASSTDRAKSLISAYNSGDASIRSLGRAHRDLSEFIDSSTEAMTDSEAAAYRNAVAMDAEVVAVLDAAKAWSEYEKDVERFNNSRREGIGPTAPGSGSAGYSGPAGTMKGSVNAAGGLTDEQWMTLPESVRTELSRLALHGTQTLTMGLGMLPAQGGKEIVSLSKAINPEAEINQRAQQAYIFDRLKAGQTTVVNNFTQSISRSDIENIVNNITRNSARA